MTAAAKPDAADRAMVAIAVVVGGAAVVFLKGILIPFALALILMVVVDSLARQLRRWAPALPEPVSVILALGVTALIVFGALFMAADNARGFATQLRDEAPKLDGLLARIGGVLGLSVTPTVHSLIAQLHIFRRLGGIAAGVEQFAIEAVLVLVYLLFLLGSRASLGRKARSLFGSEARRERAAEVFARIRIGVERYLRVQILLALIDAAASWALMAAVGLDDAAFWAFLVFLASFIPIIGGAVGLLLPPLFALLQFDTYWQAIVLAAGSEAIHLVVGNVLAPRLQGATLNLDAIVVVLSLALWGLAWGAPGMLLSTPLTVTAIIVLGQFDSSRWLAVLLSGDGRPDAHAEPAPA